MDETNDELRFSLSISTDKDEFLRRTCPSCGRDYKTEVSDGDLTWILAPQFKQLGFEIGQTDVDSDVQNRTHESLYCPYCSDVSDASETMTEETIEYLKRYVTREYLLPQINRAFSGFAGINKKSKGMFSLDISYSRSILPPRPIHGPEIPDMKIIHLLCCDNKIKVSEGWNALSMCPYCAQSVIVL